MGAFALASQLSILIIPIFAGFLWLTYRAIRRSHYIDDRVLAGVLVGGMIMAILIDLVDVLWFVPTIWLPMIVCDGLAIARLRATGASNDAPASTWHPSPVSR
jgi:hypothetical protein